LRLRFPESRDIDAHKNSWEHVLFVGGFDGMEGALILAASAFFEAGAGIATALTTEGARRIIAGKVPELMTASFAAGERWNEIIEKCNSVKNDSVEGVIPEIRRMLADFFSARKPFPLAVIGPGMGRSVFSRAVCMALFEGLRDFGISRAVIDGDGLYHFAEYLSQSKPLHAEVLITPHFLEASRIGGKSVDDIRKNRFAAAGELARFSESIVLLKGPASIVSDGETWRINTTGNPALATAGSGDVLCGIIASIASRKVSLFEAASIGAWLHGAASDRYVRQKGKNAMKARDIIANLPEVLRNFS
jgi:NAD(P)H-hydrate epimerase